MNVIIYMNGKKLDGFGDIVSGKDVGFAKESEVNILEALYKASPGSDLYAIVETNN